MKTLFENGYVYLTEHRMFRKADILSCDGIIEKIGENIDRSDVDVVVGCEGKYIIPGLVDIHTHGRGGHDFNFIDRDTVKEMRASYAKAGTTTVMATLASAEMDSLLNSAEIINENRTPEKGLCNLAGIHLEGRYLNPKRRGAHAEKLLAPLKCDELEFLVGKMSPLPVHISSAFELEGGEEFLECAKRLGATCSLAHSDATYAEAVNAVEHGVTSFTHTYNAMRPIHHREPGNMVASLLCDEAYSEFICDGEHSHPAMIKLAYRAKPHDKIILITDSLEAAGCPDGEYSIAGLPVYVKNGRAVNSDGVLAGSTLDLFTAVKNFMRFTGAELEEVIPMATANPAAMLGISGFCGSIKEGLRAEFITVGSRENPALEEVYIGGERV